MEVFDLEHLGQPGAIATYLVEEPEPALVDPGPATCLPRLREVLEELGCPVSELRHLLLTHVHLDHAGASGALVAENPKLRVHVHEDGAPHMADPERLVASTRRTFGEAHDRLWGRMAPVPRDRIRAWRPDDPTDPLPGIRPISTPGHIDHHLAYLDEGGGTLFAGDSMGIILDAEAPTHPPTPPPSLDLAAWQRTLDALSVLDPGTFAVTHFGVHGSFHRRREQLGERLNVLEARVRDAMDRDDVDAEAERYEEEVRRRQSAFLGRERVDRYFDTFSAATDFRGVRFHLERREGGS